MRRNLRSLGISLILALLFFGSGTSADSTPDIKRLVALFESRYKSARTLQATFLENYTENGRFVRAEAGTAFFRRPGKMRWEYQSPEKNLFLIDGKMAWFYVPADHTATRVPAKESTDWRTPLALLAGEMKVSRICAQIQLAPGEAPGDPGNSVLSCQLRGVQPKAQDTNSPKDTRNVEEPSEAVYFEVVRNSGELVRVLVRNSGGVGIEFQFRNWRYDPSVDESLFRFTVPRGVAIVNGELPAGDSGINP